MDDLGQVLGVEQGHLQWPVVTGEFGDRRCPQRGDPPEIGWGVGVVVEFAQHADARGGDHAAITHQHQVGEAEGGGQFGDDLGERDRVGGIPAHHPHRHRPSAGVGEHPVLDLRAALLAVAGIPVRGQLTTPPGHPRTGQVKQRHPMRVCLRAQVFGGQFALDRILAVRQPVHRRVDLVGRRPRHVQIDTQRGIGPP
uniref:hypothetical protein n=1 Tax=Mycobacterium lacus TaxID=169765 RepID=UPI0013D19051|nr:hypothetical protein [Mycobacterium lacus]